MQVSSGGQAPSCPARQHAPRLQSADCNQLTAEKRKHLSVVMEGSYGKFVLSTCTPSHVTAARMGVDDWQPTENPAIFVSPSTGFVHECSVGTCRSWILRFVDGVKICAISGRLLMDTSSEVSPRKRMMENDERSTHTNDDDTGDSMDDESALNLSSIKRHQNRPLPGSSAYLNEKYGLETPSSLFPQPQSYVEQTFLGNRFSQN